MSIIIRATDVDEYKAKEVDVNYDFGSIKTCLGVCNRGNWCNLYLYVDALIGALPNTIPTSVVQRNRTLSINAQHFTTQTDNITVFNVGSTGVGLPIVSSDIPVIVEITSNNPDDLFNSTNLHTVREYFDTPASGSGTATVEIDIEGERLTFESQMLGNTITRFINDDAQVDMEE